ncbi:hypothetical protein [Nocardioides sp.]|uniref:hypothetical protein n=1 Tax=Nocardioides sp. TaxID=35761 RepID=UPI0035199F72
MSDPFTPDERGHRLRVQAFVLHLSEVAGFIVALLVAAGAVLLGVILLGQGRPLGAVVLVAGAVMLLWCGRALITPFRTDNTPLTLALAGAAVLLAAAEGARVLCLLPLALLVIRLGVQSHGRRI